MPPPTPSQYLTPSQLGTKEFWDQTYAADLHTHGQNPEYTGTSWFSDTLASSKVVKYLLLLRSLAPPLSLSLRKTTFLDLGTGNGEMLFRLREQGGFRGRMLGVDYSAASVALARKIAERKEVEAEVRQQEDEEEEAEEEEGERGLARGVEFRVWDILKDAELGEVFDVVLDKGTFDAVSLSDEMNKAGRRVCEGYRERVERLVKGPGGLLVVTSCNWTEEELRGWFEVEGGQLEFEGRIEYPRFSFGGQTGQSVSSVCFRRK